MCNRNCYVFKPGEQVIVLADTSDYDHETDFGNYLKKHGAGPFEVNRVRWFGKIELTNPGSSVVVMQVPHYWAFPATIVE